MITTITRAVNWTILFMFIACFSYQILYLIAPYIKKAKEHLPEKRNRYAVLIAARNEEKVIGQLIESIHNQNYPQELIDIYVVADNCTDSTAEIALQEGAYVYERFNQIQVGKGYALKFLLEQIFQSGNMEDYDGFFIFDADNLLDENYVTEMNRTFSDGYKVVTSYRNSKNFGDNWISSGYALWFLHEAQFLNKGRLLLGNSCMVSGTGYVIAREVLERNDGWNFFLLTEDIEFTADCIVNDIKIGYCEKAVFYDEQPTRFQDSWHQRLRWIKGYFQVYRKYGKQLFQKLGKANGFSSFDMLMANLPAFVMTSIATVASVAMTVAGLMFAEDISFVLFSVVRLVVQTSLGMFALGVYTMLTEWKHLPYSLVSENRVLFYLPDLYADLYSDCVCGAETQGGVETDPPYMQSVIETGEDDIIVIIEKRYTFLLHANPL